MELTTISAEINNEILLYNLDAAEQGAVLAIKDSIDISDEKAIMGLGSDISKEISELNKAVLSTVKVKDIPEIEEVLPKLNAVFQQVDSTSLMSKKQGLFSKLFKTDQISEFITRFENAEDMVSEIQKNLQRVEMELRKDVELEDKLGLQNLDYIKRLQQYILAMKLKLNDELANIEVKQKEVDANDFVALQLLEEEKDKIESLDKQIFWLEQQKLLAIQTLPVLRNLKNNNKDMIRQISLTVQQSIPAWEQSIILAFHMHRQQGALRIERAVHEMTNRIVKQNSQLLKENSIEIVRAVQSGMIDIETFREANQNLIETSKMVVEAKNNAMRIREQQLEEYRRIAEKLLETEKRDMTKLAYGSVGELHA